MVIGAGVVLLVGASVAARRGGVPAPLARGAARVRRAWDGQLELQERLALRRRPWLEEFAHWAQEDDGRWVLHGHRAPPRRGTSSTTRSGWCPGLAAAARSAPSAGDRTG